VVGVVSKRKAALFFLLLGALQKTLEEEVFFSFSAKAARGAFGQAILRIPFSILFDTRSSASLAHRFSFISIGMGRLEAALSPGIELGGFR